MVPSKSEVNRLGIRLNQYEKEYIMGNIRVLILTGVNNHDWKRTAPFCKDLHEKTGRFDVEISDEPSTTLSS